MATPARHTQKLAAHLQRKFELTYDNYTDGIDILPGRKYDKIITVGTSQRFVHAFVDRETGDLYKPEGWNKPAKGVRGNIATPEGLWEVVERADRYGSYLYK